jgi:hypothetical protein
MPHAALAERAQRDKAEVLLEMYRLSGFRGCSG